MKQDLKKLVGIGSSKQVLNFNLDTSLLRASESRCGKLLREVPVNPAGQSSKSVGEDATEICFCTLSILELKK